MTPEFLAAVIDTLLPGDDVLSSGSAAGVRLDDHAVLRTIAARSGGEATFVAASEPARIAVLEAIERTEPAAFRALVTATLADYCDSPAVLTALGWSAAPPQPTGHRLLSTDESRTSAAQRRPPLWRA